MNADIPLCEALCDPTPYLNEMSLSDYLDLRYPTLSDTLSDTPRKGCFCDSFSPMEYGRIVAVLNNDIRISLKTPHPDRSKNVTENVDQFRKVRGGIAKTPVSEGLKSVKNRVGSVGGEPQ